MISSYRHVIYAHHHSISTVVPLTGYYVRDIGLSYIGGETSIRTEYKRRNTNKLEL